MQPLSSSPQGKVSKNNCDSRVEREQPNVCRTLAQVKVFLALEVGSTKALFILSSHAIPQLPIIKAARQDFLPRTSKRNSFIYSSWVSWEKVCQPSYLYSIQDLPKNLLICYLISLSHNLDNGGRYDMDFKFQVYFSQ